MSGFAAQRSMRCVGERGQAAVLAALSLFTMVVFLALAVNTGILVNDRIRIQNSTDFSAYAGGFEQARTMNEITKLNEGIYEHVQRIRGVLNYGPTFIASDAPDDAPLFYWTQPECSCLDYSPDAEEFITFSQRRLDAQYAAILATNARGYDASISAATRTAARNFLYPYNADGGAPPSYIGRRHLSFFQENPASPTYLDPGAPKGVVDLDRVEDTLVGYNYLRSCRCCDGCCIYPQQQVRAIQTWVYKSDTGLVYFPAKLRGVPLKNFLDIRYRGNSYFGAGSPSGTGEGNVLYGYAAAKPFEGNMGTVRPDNDNVGGSTTPQNPIYPPSTQLEDYFQATYRARVAGIHEEMGSSRSAHQMADLIRSDASAPHFQSKVNYFAH